MSGLRFGESMKSEFMFDDDHVFLNHGSYGAVPRRVFTARQRFQEELERHPDTWYRRANPHHHRASLEALCALIGAQPSDTVLVENSTTGMNAVCRSITWSDDDVILMSNLAYHQVKVMAKQFARVVTVDLGFPRSNHEILERFKHALESNTNIKLVIIDHISSPTSVLLPVRSLASLCRSHVAMVLVDGAHAPGQIPLDVGALGADFYTGNAHKWLFTTRGCAFLWVSPQYHDVIRPAVISHFHGVRFHYDFFVRGTCDNTVTAYHTLREATQFLEDLGGLDAITEYNKSLLDDAERDLQQAWGTEPSPVPPELQAPFMRLVHLPAMPNYHNTSVGAGELETRLYDQYSIQTLCMCVSGHLYIRLSAHVYNTPRDYRRLRDAVLHIKEEPEVDKADKGYNLPIMHWDLSPLADLCEVNP